MRIWSVAATILLAACPPQQSGETASGLVTESDSVPCGGKEYIHTNHTDFSQTLHLKVRNNCHAPPEDSTIDGSARLRVLDENGRVVNNQAVTILPGTVHRGTFSVPGKAKVELDCGDRGNHGACAFSYSYSP